LWPNGWMDQDETWHGIGIKPLDIVSDGDPALPRGGTALPIFGHVHCGQTAGWIKIPVAGREASAQTTLCQMGIQPLPQK